LLNALAATVQASEPGAAPGGAGFTIAPGQRMVLIGAALVLIGFFLPWFSVDLGRELERMTSQVTNVMPQFSGQPGMNPSSLPNFQFGPNGGNGTFPIQSTTINVSGGDIPHGLGWLVLVLSLGVAILPHLGTAIEPQTRRTVTLLAMGAGVIILVYLFGSNIRYLNAGIILALAGYVIESAAVIRQVPAPAFLP
jgi:hypothetical protein